MKPRRLDNWRNPRYFFPIILIILSVFLVGAYFGAPATYALGFALFLAFGFAAVSRPKEPATNDIQPGRDSVADFKQ